MTNEIEPPVAAEGTGLGRRRVLQGLITGVGAGFAGRGLAEPHPVQAHVADAAKVAHADAKSSAASWKPAFLDAYQFETLSSMAERIVPGAVKVQADRFIDQLLAVDNQDNQRQFLSALGGLDGEARARASKPWKALSEPQQVEILTAASTMEPAGSGSSRNLRDHFDHLKGWVVGAYYSTEAGMRELGYTGALFFESYPDCDHPGGHE